MPYIQLNVSWAGVESPLKFKLLSYALNNFGKEVVKVGRSNLAKQKKNSTGNLSKSLTYTIGDNNMDIAYIEFEAPNASYWKFVNWGVKGLISSAKAPKSPFQFGSKNYEGTGTLRGGIDSWIKSKPISQWQSLKTGRFLSYKQMASMISREVYLNGIAPSYFYSSAFERVWKRSRGKIEDALGEDYAVFTEGKMPPEIMVNLEI
jgi:hypothetical protein